MAQVNVLLLNGRRQNVKVTPNTTILEVLEQVCAKNDLSSPSYDLKHHRTILDVTSTIRFAGIPQNAQLELVEAKKPRVENDVILCLQLTTGERLEGNFPPSANLLDVVENIAPSLLAEYDSPAIIYMRRDIVGKENLAATSLRSIGLTGGRAALRLINKSHQELRTQANVSAPLQRKKEPAPTEAPAEALPPEPLKSMELSSLPSSPTVTELDSALVAPESCPPIIPNGEKTPQQSQTSAELSPPIGAKRPRVITPEQPLLPEISTSLEKDPEPVAEKVNLLGDRSAVAYSLDNAPPPDLEDFPDDFYELSLSDVRSLASSSRRALKDLEDRPMLTSQLRKLDEDGLVLQKLSQYKSCVVRVRFPDGSVLQGCFKPIETIQDVVDFVRMYLAAVEMPFYLYTAPPKKVLDPGARLVEADCVPSAILYLGTEENLAAGTPFLNNAVISQFSSYSAAAAKANELRGSAHKKVSPSEERQVPSDESLPSTSSQRTNSQTYIPSTENLPSTSRSQLAASEEKHVPKWLKLSKK